MWMQILAIIAIVFLIWWLFRYIQQNKEALSLKNLNKSFSTMGFLALGLIAFIAVLVFALRH